MDNIIVGCQPAYSPSELEGGEADGDFFTAAIIGELATCDQDKSTVDFTMKDRAYAAATI